MDKLVLIDGNSLLNRAFYAIRLFTTKDGLPTNGVFGFTKLLFKIIEDERPQYLVCTFDLHAPTFRHKRYAAYKAQRKPMPQELAVQVPVLKDLLRAMKVRILEKEGYEADDLIGTLSRRFRDVSVLIYTGDRDSYQLVKENVSVCFTKRGVSDIDLLNDRNFFEKVGLTPAQIIEEKALMGDSSDNIPGVNGIGEKTALSLLKSYQTLDGVYEHLEELPASQRKKLDENRAAAYLSRELATIDVNVPLDLTLNDCRLSLPFPKEARDACVKLEFRSLLNSDYLEKDTTEKANAAPVQTTVCSRLDEFLQESESAAEFAFIAEKDAVHVSFGKREFIFRLKKNLLDGGFFREELKPVFSTVFQTGRTVYTLDAKRLKHQLADLGVDIACPIEDVSLLWYMINSNRRAAEAKDLPLEYGLPGENKAYALFLSYREAAEKTAGTEEEKLYRNVELPLTEVLFGMEQDGVRVDEKKFPEFSEKYHAELESLSRRIYELGGVDSINLNSPFQLSQLLFGKLGYSPQGAKKNLHGGYSTNAEVLEKLAEEHEIARLILRYREVQKLQSTYIDGIRPLIADGIIHTTYNQTMTTTGRLSSANPNLQNIPVRTEEGRELRKLFIAREGNLFADADYSQIELRLLAHFSGCKPLIQAYNQGKDIHAETASQVFGVALNEVTPLMRRKAKAVNFGIIYGISAFGLSKDLNISTQEAQSYINRYFETYTDVKEYIQENVERAKKDGYVTTILGRKRFIAELSSSNRNVRSFGERAAMNMPLQGSAADIIKLAMLGVSRRLKQEGSRARLVLQVHDELVLDTPEEELERVCSLLKEEMENAVSLSVPLTVEITAGKSWYECK